MHQSQKSRSLQTRPKFQQKNSTAVLNEYYHKRFKEGMQNISKLSRLHDRVTLNDTDGSIDERQQLSWQQYSREREKKEQQKAEKEKKKGKATKKDNNGKKIPPPKKTLKEELREQVGYSRKKQHSKEHITKIQAPVPKHEPVFIAPFVSERFPSQPPDILLKTSTQEERKSSNKSSNKQSQNKASILSKPSSMKQSDVKSMSSASFSIIKLRKVQSEYHDRSDTMSNAGNPFVSEIIKNNDLQIDEGREKSIYSLALQSHKYKRKKSPDGRQKKNFKKAFLQKKYNTSHLSQIHHKIEKQNELYVRNIKKVGAVNFSSVMHMRKAEKEAAEDVRNELKAFEFMKETIYRQISQPESDFEAEQQSVQALMALRKVKPIYEDTTSAIQNIEIKQYDIEQSVISEEQVPAPQNQESLAHYQAIYQAFQDRSRGSKQEMSSSFSRYYTTQKKTQEIQNQAIQENSNQESLRSQQYHEPTDQERYNRIIGDQIFGFVKHIDFEDNTFFQNSLQRLITLTQKIKYNSKEAMASTKQRVLLIIQDLLEERVNAKNKYLQLKKQQSNFRQMLEDHVDHRGNIIQRHDEDRYMEEVSKALSDKVQPGQPAERSILVNKVIIKKLIEKSCQLFTQNVLAEV